MSAIGSRFNSLVLNARDPLDGVKKKTKKNKKDQKTKPQIPKTVQPIIEVNKIAEIVEEIKPTTVFKKSQSVIVRDVMDTKTREKIQVTTTTVNVPPIVNEKNLENNISVTDKSELDDQVVEKDERAVRVRSTYKKMIVSQGRVLDRHGGPNTRVKPLEKRQGRGAYNWGDSEQAETDVTLTEEKETNQNADAATQKEAEVVQYTYEQYKKLLQENKVDPLAWEIQNSLNVSEVTENDTSDFREYDYSRQNISGNRGRGSGRYQRGRGEFRGHGDRGFIRGDRRNSRGVERRESTSFLKELRVDDINDFPEL